MSEMGSFADGSFLPFLATSGPSGDGPVTVVQLLRNSIRLSWQSKRQSPKGSAGMVNGGNVGAVGCCEAAIDALDGMEPELRQLKGLILAQRLIGESQDHVEPLATSAIARRAYESLGNLEQRWHGD